MVTEPRATVVVVPDCRDERLAEASLLATAFLATATDWVERVLDDKTLSPERARRYLAIGRHALDVARRVRQSAESEVRP